MVYDFYQHDLIEFELSSVIRIFNNFKLILKN